LYLSIFGFSCTNKFVHWDTMKSIHPDKTLQPFVKEILFLEETDTNADHSLPIYADGFPGVMYSRTKHGVVLHPRNKRLSELFLFGQTIEPISLSTKGAYRYIVFRLYPFASRLLLGINPKELNDDCYDLLLLKNIDVQQTTDQLNQTDNLDRQINLISNLLTELVKHSSSNADFRIKLAVNTIINAKGNITIKKVREQLHISERTFERHFTKEIGVTPKQFAKIIQFNFSLNQLTEDDYISLTTLSYDRGFSDQSHFIKTFKRFTGKTPKEFI